MPNRPENIVEGYRVTTRLLDETFAGPVSASTMAELRASQHSRRLLLLKVVREHAPHLEDSWRILVAADRRSPDAVRQVLTYPAVGTWLVRAIRKARGVISDSVPVAAELDYLTSVAAAAAIRAGVPASIDVPVWHGLMSLPTIGRFDIGNETVRQVRVGHTGAQTHVELNGSRVPLGELPALPLRRHRSLVDGVEVWWTVDDVDPYRAFSTIERPTRLNQREYELWCELLDDAWAVLVRHHADYAAELTHVDPVVVPVPRSRGLVASSSSSSFGAIVVATPESGADLAEILVHELQHSKLNALLDLVRLADDATRLCYAPWRRDPRPLPGLLHGIYAFMSVTEYWRRQRHVGPGDRAADVKYIHHREQVRAALRAVATMPELSEFGTRLVGAVEERLAACDADVVSGELTEIVALLLAEHRLSWRASHLMPATADVNDLARSWGAGSAPSSWRDSVLAPGNRPQPDFTLSALLMAKAHDPDRFVGLAGNPGDRELVDGRHTEAVRAFSTRIAANPDDDAAWVGLLAATRGDPDERVPIETVSATYRRLGVLGGAVPEPITLVDWFADRAGPG